MKIQKLTIRNFMAVGEIDALPLDDKGLILIQGNNEDDSSQSSNGAGKSTIAEALCWALYGETARGESGDAVINDVAKKGTEVVVEVLDETGGVYRISRYRKHKTYKNMLRLELEEFGSWKDLTKGTDKLTQEVVNKVVGCTHEVFASAIYAGQEAMPDLPGMTDKQLKTLIEEAAGINELQQAHEVARRKMNEAKLKVADLTAQFNAVNLNIGRLTDNVDDFAKRVIDWDRNRQERFDLKTKEADAVAAAIDPSLATRISDRIASIQKEIQTIADQIAGSDDERNTEKRLVAEHQAAVMAQDRVEREADLALKHAQEAKHKLDHIESKVGESCGSCGHVIEAGDVAGAKELAKKLAVEKVTAAKQLKADVEAARERTGNAADALSVFRSSMTDVSALAAQQQTLSANVVKLKEALQKESAKHNQLLTLQNQGAAILAEVNPHAASLETFKQQLSDAKDQLGKISDDRDISMQELTIAEEAVRVFGPAGVRAHILDTVTPQLNDRTSHYLSALTDGNITAVWSTISTTSKGELREKFTIDVVSATGAKSFKGLSGGEKRKVRLACAMALQDMVASRASKPIKLFIADEIDHALDPAGLERLMVILDEKSRDKGTVLVISHSDLRDHIRTSITITKKGGKSYLEPTCL